MTDRNGFRTAIEKAYEARRTGDIRTILSLFHPQGKFELVGAREHSAVAGSAVGHEELQAALEKLIAGFEFVQREIVTMIMENNQAAVHSRVKLRFVPKDRMLSTELLDLWKFEDGKIIELLEFADTAAINDLMA